MKELNLEDTFNVSAGLLHPAVRDFIDSVTEAIRKSLGI
jgi:hypothetical protein